MRALGNVIKQEGQYNRVYGPLMIIAYDWVTIPSHDKAYMTKTLSESARLEQNGILTEGLINFSMADLAEYVTREDERINAICESLGFDMESDFSNVDVDRKNKLISIKEGNETLKLFLKTSVVNNMDNYFKYRF